jgi:hypothetical protein
VVEYLTILEECFGVEWGDLDDSDDFFEFVNSPQYETWLAAHDK